MPCIRFLISIMEMIREYSLLMLGMHLTQLIIQLHYGMMDSLTTVLPFLVQYYRGYAKLFVQGANQVLWNSVLASSTYH